MPKFLVRCTRHETYSAETEVDAADAESARRDIDDKLGLQGWDSVFDGEDGDYESCYSDIVSVTEVPPPEHLRGEEVSLGPHEITIEIRGGVLQDVRGLPEGWTYTLIDHDVLDCDEPTPE